MPLIDDRTESQKRRDAEHPIKFRRMPKNSPFRDCARPQHDTNLLRIIAWCAIPVDVRRNMNVPFRFWLVADRNRWIHSGPQLGATEDGLAILHANLGRIEAFS